MAAGNRVLVRATDRGFFRGQRFRPGMTVLVPADMELLPWMQLVAPGEVAAAPINALPEPVALSELADQRARKNAKAQAEAKPNLLTKKAVEDLLR